MPIKDFKVVNCSKYNKIKKPKAKSYYFAILSLLIIVNIAILLYISYPKVNLTAKNKISLNNSALILKKWKSIIIHHGGGKTNQGDARSYDNFHLTKFNTGLLYHFVIGNGQGKSKDGEIEIGFRWKEQISGSHVSNPEYKDDAIGIVLVGDFNHFHPTNSQMANLISLVKYLMNNYNIDYKNVYTHDDVVKTQCPGKFFPKDLFFQSISEDSSYEFDNNLAL